MKKLLKRKIWWLSSAILGVTVVSVATPLLVIERQKNTLNTNADNKTSDLTSSSNANLYNGAIQFNGKWYNTVDQAASAFISKNPVTQNKYIGDINNAYASRDLHTIDLNSNLIKKYDSTKLSKAYADQSSTSGYTDSYQEALEGTIPIYQRQIRYDDYSGKELNLLPTDQETAKKNLINNLSFAHPIPYYEVTDVNGNVQNINPLNANDINRLKTIAVNNVKNLDYNQTKNGFSKSQFYNMTNETNTSNGNAQESNSNIYVKADNLSQRKTTLTSFLYDVLQNFASKIKVQPSISLQTSINDKPYSYQKNYAFKLNGKEIGNTISGNCIPLFEISEDNKLTGILKLNDNIDSINQIYKSFSTKDEMNKYWNVDENAYSANNALISWHAGGKVTLKTDNKTDSEKFKNYLENVFGKKNLSIEKNSNLQFIRSVAPGTLKDYTFFRILESPPAVTYNYWKSSANNWQEIWDKNADIRQVYFKFENSWWFGSDKQELKLNSFNSLSQKFNNYFGIEDGSGDKNWIINQKNQIFQDFKKNYISCLLFGTEDANFNDDILTSNKLLNSVDFNNLYGEIINELKENLLKYFTPNIFSNTTKATYSYNPKNLPVYDDSCSISFNEKDNNSINLSTVVSKNIKDNKNNSTNLVDVINYNGIPLFMESDKSGENGWLNVSNKLTNYKGYDKSVAIDLSSSENYWINYDNWLDAFKSQVKEDTGKEIDDNSLESYLSGIIASTNKNPDTTIKTNEDFSPGIFSALYYYEKTLANFTNPTSSKFEGLESRLGNRIDMNDKENNQSSNYNNFVILYSKSNSSKSNSDSSTKNFFIDKLEEMHYGEYLGRLIDFNDSFEDLRAFYNNSVDKAIIVANLDYYNPPQITFYVDKKGKVIALDPIGYDINVSPQPTQSMYDSVDLVTTNATNNTIIKQDPTVVFYKDGNEKILLKNNIEFLYSIKINNQTIVFDAYNYVFSYVKQYIVENGNIA